MDTKKFLTLIHKLNYLQYPFIIIGVIYSFKPNFIENSNTLEDFNLSLSFLGIALSFTGLSDVSKIKGITKRVLTHPRNGKIYIVYLVILFFLFFGIGIYAYFQNEDNTLKELSTGMIILSIGIISLIKMSVEIIEHFSEA